MLETAVAIRELLDSEGFDCWPKLTGGSGVHLMAPIDPKQSGLPILMELPAMFCFWVSKMI